MKVKEAYTEYQIPKNLQEHMLRTASLAEILLDGWKGPEVDSISIVKALSIHDIAKPMDFDLAKQAQYGMSEEEIEELRLLQIRIKENFGNSEHEATVGIAREIGCNEKTVRLVDNLEWVYIPRLMAANDTNSLIPIYCDMRIGTKGILTLKERLEDLKNRTQDADYNENVKNGKALEALIINNVSLDVNSIRDMQINDKFEALLNLSLI